MKIIIIRGSINSGKTLTTGLLYSKLLTIATVNHVFNWENVSSNWLVENNSGSFYDFTSILTIGKVRVGIISAGDIAKYLKIDIETMITNNVDVLICCARSINRAGSCYRMIIDDYSEKHSIIKEIWPKYSKDETKKNEIKNDAINEIFQIIKPLTNI